MNLHHVDHGKRRRKTPDLGAVAREAKAGREAAQKGIKVMQIVAMTGLSYPTVRGVVGADSNLTRRAD